MTTSALRASYAGLTLTMLATVLPFVDRVTLHTLADHIRAGYPAYDGAEVSSAVTTWLVVLAVVGLLGSIGWIWTIWTITVAKPWARWSAVALLIAATGIALAALTIQDTSGEVGLAPLLAWIGVLPCVAGLAATVLLWRRSP